MTVHSKRTAKIWKIPNGEIISEFTDNLVDITCAELTPDEKFMVTASDKGHIAIHELSTGKRTLEFPKLHSRITTLAISHDGSYMITALEDKKCQLWYLGSGTQIHELTGHKQKVIFAVYVNNGSSVLTISKADCFLWDIESINKISAYASEEDFVNYAVKNNKLTLETSSGNVVFF